MQAPNQYRSAVFASIEPFCLVGRLIVADTSVVLPSREAESLLAPGSRTMTHQQKRAATAGRLAYPIAVFRTKDGRGWGGRAECAIPKGIFVCSYVGELITRAESDGRSDSLYFSGKRVE